MKENLLRRLSAQELLCLAVNTIDDLMALIEINDKDAIEKKRDELYLLNQIIKEKEFKKMGNPS